VSAALRKPFGIYTKGGALVYLGLHASAEDAWHIYLGWPSESEVADAKARGMTAVPVTVRPDRS
jgi:hypothetical protein